MIQSTLFFYAHEAERFGVEEAIMLQHLRYWILKNKSENRNYANGHYWTYNSYRAFEAVFPFWTKAQIRRVLHSLEKQGVIRKDQLAGNSWNRTSWYTITSKKLLEVYKDKRYSKRGF